MRVDMASLAAKHGVDLQVAFVPSKELIYKKRFEARGLPTNAHFLRRDQSFLR